MRIDIAQVPLSHEIGVIRRRPCDPLAGLVYMDCFVPNLRDSINGDQEFRLPDAEEAPGINLHKTNFGLAVVDEQLIDVTEFLPVLIENLSPTDVLRRDSYRQARITQSD